MKIVTTITTLFLLFIACDFSSSSEIKGYLLKCYSSTNDTCYFPINVEEVEIVKRVVNDTLTQFDTNVVNSNSVWIERIGDTTKMNVSKGNALIRRQIQAGKSDIEFFILELPHVGSYVFDVFDYKSESNCKN